MPFCPQNAHGFPENKKIQMDFPKLEEFFNPFFFADIIYGWPHSGMAHESPHTREIPRIDNVEFFARGAGWRLKGQRISSSRYVSTVAPDYRVLVKTVLYRVVQNIPARFRECLAEILPHSAFLGWRQNILGQFSEHFWLLYTDQFITYMMFLMSPIVHRAELCGDSTMKECCDLNLVRLNDRQVTT